MPKFHVTSPDGRTIEVEAPEGATEDQAIKYAQDNWTSLSKQVAPEAPELGTIAESGATPGTKEQAPAATEKPWTQKLEEGIQGAGEVAASLATAIPATVAGGAAGIYRGVTGGKFGTPEGVREAEQAAADVSQQLTYEPKSEKGKEYSEQVSSLLQESGLGGLPVAAGEMGALSHIPAKTLVAQVAEHPSVQAAQQVAGRIAPAAKKVATSLIPQPTEQTIALARKADEMGIPLRPDMLSDNRIVRMIGDALEKVPVSGAKGEQRRVAFNRAIMETIGADPKATKLTPDVFDKAITTSGKTIGDISAKTDIPLDEKFNKAIDAHATDAAKFETADVAKIIDSYAKELRAKSENGVIPGMAFRRLNSKINTQIRNTQNGDLKHALSLFQEDMHDALERNLSPEDRTALADARKKYAHAKLLEPLVAKSTEGDISPAGLMGVVTATKSQKGYVARGKGGKIADIAKIGQRFIKEPPSSGTAERSLGYGMLGGGLATHPAGAAAVYGLANAYNRLAAGVTKNIIKESGKSSPIELKSAFKEQEE